MNAEPDPLPTNEVDAEPPDAHVASGRFSASGFDAQDGHTVALAGLCELASDVLEGEGLAEGRVDIHLVDLDTMTGLNAEHMGADRPTDVLAFPLETDPFSSLDGEPPLVGDIVICPAVAVEQAADHAGTVEAEFALLVIHGVLHLLGHDHAEPDETIEMQARERAYLAQRGFSHPEPTPADTAAADEAAAQPERPRR